MVNYTESPGEPRAFDFAARPSSRSCWSNTNRLNWRILPLSRSKSNQNTLKVFLRSPFKKICSWERGIRHASPLFVSTYNLRSLRPRFPKLPLSQVKERLNTFKFAIWQHAASPAQALRKCQRAHQYIPAEQWFRKRFSNSPERTSVR